MVCSLIIDGLKIDDDDYLNNVAKQRVCRNEANYICFIELISKTLPQHYILYKAIYNHIIQHFHIPLNNFRIYH